MERIESLSSLSGSNDEYVQTAYHIVNRTESYRQWELSQQETRLKRYLDRASLIMLLTIILGSVGSIGYTLAPTQFQNDLKSSGNGARSRLDNLGRKKDYFFYCHTPPRRPSCG